MPTEPSTEATAEAAPAPTEEPAVEAIHDPGVPLPEAARQALSALPSERIDAPDQFYYRSNERRHDLIAGDLAGRGGAVIGVGADQVYTLAAMAGSSLIVAVDYDNRIPLMHDIYQVLVPRSETADALIAHFEETQERATRTLLEEAYEGAQERRVVRVFRRIRGEMHRYLGRVKERSRAGQPGSWLADPALYAHVRQLFVNGRVFARTGDVTGTTTLRSVGQTLRELGVPVRIVYFSNAEQFFAYTPDFRANMEALPTDGRTLVVRTIRHARIPNADDDRWHYVVQDFVDFGERLALGVYGRSTILLEDLAQAGAPFIGDGVSHMTTELPRFAAERRANR